MTARIDLGVGTGGTSVRVAGRLDEPSARELVALCSHRRGLLIVDLAELVSADRFAIEVLRDLRSAGARIVGASTYIGLVLNDGPERPATTTESPKEEEE